MDTNETPEAPVRIFKNASYYAVMPLKELKALDKDTQAALSIKLLAMQANTLSRISQNVSFFFWLTVISLAATIIVLVGR
jgi:hypothetical protein